MSDGHSRRELLRLAAATSPVAAGGLGIAGSPEFAGRLRGSGTTPVEGTVRDLRGDPLPGMDVTVVHLPPGERHSGVGAPTKCRQAREVVRGPVDEHGTRDPTLVDEPFVLGRTTAGADGGFEAPDLPAEAGGAVVLVAVGRPEGADSRWFGMERLGAAAYRGAESAGITVDSRLLYADQAVREEALDRSFADDVPVGRPYAKLLAWEEIDPDAGYERTVHVETSGDQYHPAIEDDFVVDESRNTPGRGADAGTGTNEDDRALDREDYVSQVDAGLTTLQVPEEVAVGYEVGDGNPRTPPAGLWTDDAADTPPTICQTTRLGLGFTDRTAAGLLPTYPALATTGEQHFRAYADGRRERLQRDREELVLSVASLLVGIVGALPTGGVGVAVTLSLLGLALGEFDSDDPTALPPWASADERETLGIGSLAPDFDRYDFVPSQWQYDTFGFVQPYPLRFDDDTPRALCLRGLYRINLPQFDEPRTDDSRKRLVQLEHRFRIDPSVVSPLDEAGGSEVSFESAPPAPPVPSIDVGDRAPTVGEAVAFDASVRSFPRPDGVGPTIDSYDWEFLPPDVERTEFVDVTGDGTAEQLTQNDYRDARATAGGESVTRRFEVPGEHLVVLTVTDERGRTARASTYVSVQEPPPVEIPPIATDAGTECHYPPTGERRPATGEDAARHLGYGCGDWKVYRVAPGETYSVALTVDDCHGCVLSDATHVLEEPAGDPSDDFAAATWEPEREWTDPLGEAAAGEVVEYTYVPASRYVRIRNRHGNGGLGFYCSLYGPRPDTE